MTSFFCAMILFFIAPAHATDYTRLAQEIARESLPQRDSAMGDAQRFIEKTKEKKQPFVDFEGNASAFKTKEVFQRKNSGKTCRASKMDVPASKARYQGESGLYIFVSLSFPDEVLKTLSRQAKTLGGTLVIRGLVDNSFKATQKRVRELGIPLNIDPTLFERFEVKHIPTFVLTTLKDGKIKGSFDKVTGNVSVKSALELFSQEGELRNLAQSLLQKRKESLS